MVTRLRMKAFDVSIWDSSMMRALARTASALEILASSMPWASLAASYSAFSLRSPLSRASAICWEMAGRSTVFMWCSSSLSFWYPSGV